jgi:protein-tyrosine phosphatase
VRPVYNKLKDGQIKRRLLRRHKRLLHRLNAAGGPGKIVFLCYGNICRSPLAAALAEQKLSGVVIDSAGFHDQTGRSCPQKILRIASSYGINLSNHRSARATRDQLANADLVIAMDLENLDRACLEFPEIADRITLLGLFGPETLAIADPYLADEPATNRICEQVRAGVEGLASWMAKAKSADCTPAIPSTAAGSQ